MRVEKPIRHFLGLEFDVQPGFIKVHQLSYTLALIRDCDPDNTLRPALTPAEVGLRLTRSMCAEPGSEEAAFMATKNYSSLVSRLAWLQRTRPDLSYITSLLRRFLTNPGRAHLNAFMRVIRYLKTYPALGLVYRASGKGTNMQLSASVDSSFAENWRELETRSQTGCLIFLAGGPVSFCSIRQPNNPFSTADSEMQALAVALKELMWLRNMLEAAGFPQEAIQVAEDNAAVVAITSNPSTTNATKHLVVRYLWIKEQLSLGHFTLVQTPTDQQLADMLTKSLSKEVFDRHRAVCMG
jgi:hypothetical protein